MQTGTVKTYDLNWYSDPGHAWLRVKKADALALGITGKVSQYSYHKGQYAYLEEDCDAGLFIEAAQAAGAVVLTTDHNSPDNDSHVRRMQRITSPTIWQSLS